MTWRGPSMGMDLMDEDALGLLGWILVIFIVLVLLGVVGFTIRW